MEDQAFERTRSGRVRRYITGYIILILLLGLLIVLNINTGSVELSVGEVAAILTGGMKDATAYNIIWDIRLPRLITAMLLGGILSVAGFILQTFFSNPIAGPFVLGISSGAKLIVALTLIYFLGRGINMSSVMMIVSAFIGALMSMGFILLVSARVKRMSILIICGVMVGYICSAITDFVVTFADDSNIVNLHNWSMGSFSGAAWGNVGIIAAVSLLTMVLAFMLSKPMGAYQLGEDYAKSLGVNIKVFRVELILLSSLMAALVTAFAGPISFVGIAVPHLIKSLFKTAKPIVIIPAGFLGGAVFCLFCDMIARTLFAPTELAISTVTSILGAPVVIYLMLKRSRER